MSNKKYGLILPEKGKQLQFQAKRNVFGDDSDSEDEFSKKTMLLRPSDNVNRQAKVTQEKAITEDPTVYQYDEIYDEMVGAKESEKKKSKEEKKPRYIENLLKTANKRKIENERRLERQIQKEREKEGEEFKDKEVFVTSAYKKKLEELRQEEEREKREEYLESIGDVTKQKDLGGFYRHLYEQKLGTTKSQETSQEPTNEAENCTPPRDVESKKPEQLKKRNYRKRKSTEDKNLSDGEIYDSEDEINRLNLDDIKLSKKYKPTEENIDADSDFSIDESSDEETDKQENQDDVKEEKLRKPDELQEEISEKSKKDDKMKPQNKSVSPIKTPPVEEIKPKIDIWKKRTVGDVFEQALKRYYERKAARGT